MARLRRDGAGDRLDGGGVVSRGGSRRSVQRRRTAVTWWFVGGGVRQRWWLQSWLRVSGGFARWLSWVRSGAAMDGLNNGLMIWKGAVLFFSFPVLFCINGLGWF